MNDNMYNQPLKNTHYQNFGNQYQEQQQGQKANISYENLGFSVSNIPYKNNQADDNSQNFWNQNNSFFSNQYNSNTHCTSGGNHHQKQYENKFDEDEYREFQEFRKWKSLKEKIKDGNFADFSNSISQLNDNCHPNQNNSSFSQANSQSTRIMKHNPNGLNNYQDVNKNNQKNNIYEVESQNNYPFAKQGINQPSRIDQMREFNNGHMVNIQMNSQTNYYPMIHNNTSGYPVIYEGIPRSQNRTQNAYNLNTRQGINSIIKPEATNKRKNPIKKQSQTSCQQFTKLDTSALKCEHLDSDFSKNQNEGNNFSYDYLLKNQNIKTQSENPETQPNTKALDDKADSNNSGNNDSMENNCSDNSKENSGNSGINSGDSQEKTNQIGPNNMHIKIEERKTTSNQQHNSDSSGSFDNSDERKSG